AIDKHLQHAVMMHAALAGAGLAYGPDPATPYAQMSEDPFALDYVQFPLQTLTARTGDCDDLSVAYATLLEAAGQSAALLLTPGHIFVAVKLDADPRTAMNQYLMPEDLIIHDSEVWLPVEVTHIQREFVEAWSAGARQWRESSGRGEASFIPVADAWQTYPSVAFSVSRAPFTVPDLDPIVADFQRQLEQFVRREISVREATLLDRFQSEPGDYRNRNRLAVLYARYGLYDEAEEVFQAVVADTEYLPALVNLGNLSFLRGDIAGAEAYYRRALDQGSENPAALLGMARVNYQMENYSSVRQYYERLTAASGELAGRYAYLSLRGDATSRANDVATMSTTVEWEE
ncbi:MAG: hypothetical protein KAU31_05460, partial [Spirochaetaceae bacterium]|nr:hypothetical protein [Spirochaetaceae bacterium]